MKESIKNFRYRAKWFRSGGSQKKGSIKNYRNLAKWIEALARNKNSLKYSPYRCANPTQKLRFIWFLYGNMLKSKMKQEDLKSRQITRASIFLSNSGTHRAGKSYLSKSSIFIEMISRWGFKEDREFQKLWIYSERFLGWQFRE